MARTRFRYWLDPEFPPLDEPWFIKNAHDAPQLLYQRWAAWLQAHPKATNDVRLRKALEFASGLSGSAVGHFLSGYRNEGTNFADHLSQETRSKLAKIGRSLGWTPRRITNATRKRSGRVMIVTDLTVPPNPRFHLAIIDSLVAALWSRQMTTTIFAHNPLRDSDHLCQAIRRSGVDAVVWLRLTPEPAVLGTIELPMVIVHGTKAVYPRPVVAHIVPKHTEIPQMVELWARALQAGAGRSNVIVLGAMAPESGSTPNGVAGKDLRAERIQCVRRGIERAGLTPATHFVCDYTASEAFGLLTKYPDAAGYVCLSDELAVAIKHLLEFRGEATAGRIIGFDGSHVARSHRIPSMDQHLGETGSKAVDALIAAMAFSDRMGGSLPGFAEYEIDVRLQFWSATEGHSKRRQN